MPDLFANFASGLEAPAGHVAQVAPNDAADLPAACRGIIVGVTGTLKITTVHGETVTLTQAVVVVGQILPIRVARVWATGTTASDIWVVW